MRKIYIILMLLSFSQLSAQPWHWINPTTGHQHINDISFVAPGLGIAVADDGVILQYNDNVWTQAESPVTANLNAVYYLSPTLAWAVGNNGVILKYNGDEWVQQESPTTEAIMDVCFVDENHGWAIGNCILFYNGITWLIDSNIDYLKSIDFATPEEGWAGGASNYLFHFIDGTWIKDTSLVNYDHFDIKCIEMTGPSSVQMSGAMEYDYDRGVLYEYSDNTWHEETSFGINDEISFTDYQHGYGIENYSFFTYDICPNIKRYSDGIWTTELITKIDNQFTSVKSIGENEAFTSDKHGFIYHGLNGEWSVSNGFTADSILDMDFTRANNGYFACGADGIWHYDAGIWSNELKLPGFRFNEVRFIDENSGWASAYRKTGNMPPYAEEVKVFKCNSGIWSEETIPVFEGIWEPATSLEISYWGTIGITSYNMLYTKTEGIWDTTFLSMSDSITEIRFMDPLPVKQSIQGELPVMEEAWMSIKRLDGDMKGAIYFNDFNTDNWNVSYETATGAFNDLCVADYMNIYAVGDNGLIAHFDGQTWSESEPVTNEDLLSVYINKDNEGWATGRNGTLLRYNGLSWSVVQSNTWDDLYKVSFYHDFGLIGGKNGTLISTQTQMPVGIQNPANPEDVSALIIYPNPSADNALIEFENPGGGISEIRIFDITGRLMLSNHIAGNTMGKQTIRLNTQYLNNGMYLVKINSGNLLLQGKILIQK